MPFVRYRSDRKSVYPDTSTLVYGLRELDGSARAGCVWDALCRVSRDGNLCLSFEHLLELAAQPARAVADAAALENLDYVWMYDLEHVEAAEVARLLLSATTRQTAPAFPAAPSLSSAFGRLNVEAASSLLSQAALPTLATALVAPELQRRRVELQRQGGVWARRFAADRQTPIAAPRPAEEDAAQLDAQLMGLLRERTALVHRELVSATNGDYLVRTDSGLLRFPDEAWALGQLTLPWAEPNRMPSWFCYQTVARRVATDAGTRVFGTRFFESERRAGDLFDWSHVGVAAGYVDGFVCDAQTARYLEGARPRLGLPSPIVFQNNDYERLATELIRAIQ